MILKTAAEWQNGLKQVILTPINWNPSGTYQYWATKMINGSRNLLESCTRFSSVMLHRTGKETNETKLANYLFEKNRWPFGSPLLGSSHVAGVGENPGRQSARYTSGITDATTEGGTRARATVLRLQPVARRPSARRLPPIQIVAATRSNLGPTRSIGSN